MNYKKQFFKTLKAILFMLEIIHYLMLAISLLG